MPDSKAPNGAPSPNDHDRAAGPDTITRAIHRAAVNKVNGRGRDAGSPAPPAQIRTCGIPGYGSYLG